MNKITLLGTVGRDPETKYLTNGTQVTTFSLATSESYKDKKGNKQTQTEWHHVVFFGDQAKTIQQYVVKGSKILVEGKIKTETWEASGEKKSKVVVNANSFEFISSPKKYEPKQETKTNYEPTSETTDDLPF